LVVGSELLLRQSNLADMDMIQKILSLFIMSVDKNTQQYDLWEPFKENYIEPMLRYCLAVNIYATIADILNNLSVSSFN
jgi:hypothetical protein